jgi:hypothetical protein
MKGGGAIISSHANVSLQFSLLLCEQEDISSSTGCCITIQQWCVCVCVREFTVWYKASELDEENER